MIERAAATEESDDPLRMYNSNALTYVMVNAIQELASRVVDLESLLKAAKPE